VVDAPRWELAWHCLGDRCVPPRASQDRFWEYVGYAILAEKLGIAPPARPPGHRLESAARGISVGTTQASLELPSSTPMEDSPRVLGTCGTGGTGIAMTDGRCHSILSGGSAPWMNSGRFLLLGVAPCAMHELAMMLGLSGKRWRLGKTCLDGDTRGGGRERPRDGRLREVGLAPDHRPGTASSRGPPVEYSSQDLGTGGTGLLMTRILSLMAQLGIASRRMPSGQASLANDARSPRLRSGQAY
jgi:hypothetical protein